MSFRILAATVLSSATIVQAEPAAPRPNVLIILVDDCTYNDLPVYGGQNAHTPNIDTLASQGLTFNHAYLCMSICQPCRSELNNLASQKPEVVARLEKEWDAWAARAFVHVKKANADLPEKADAIPQD